MLHRFVTFEGGEGVGKSTQIALLANSLRLMGLDVVTTREPGGSPIAERIRAFILTTDRPTLSPEVESLLFSAARADHVLRVIRPAIERGAVVLCDRFADSSFAYQGVDVDPALLSALYSESVADCGPSLTLVLDLPAEEGLSRARVRRGLDAPDRFEGEGATFHRKLRDNFLRIAAAEPDRCVVVDASQPVDDVARTVLSLVVARLGLVPSLREALV